MEIVFLLDYHPKKHYLRRNRDRYYYLDQIHDNYSDFRDWYLENYEDMVSTIIVDDCVEAFSKPYKPFRAMLDVRSFKSGTFSVCIDFDQFEDEEEEQEYAEQLLKVQTKALDLKNLLDLEIQKISFRLPYHCLDKLSDYRLPGVIINVE
jgi:hypothetical protein